MLDNFYLNRSAEELTIGRLETQLQKPGQALKLAGPTLQPKLEHWT